MWCTEQDESNLLFIQLKIRRLTYDYVVIASHQLLYIIFQDLEVTVEVQLSVVSII